MTLNNHWVIGMDNWGSWDLSQCWSRGVSLVCLWSEGWCLVQMMVDWMLKPKLQCLALADLDLKKKKILIGPGSFGGQRDYQLWCQTSCRCTSQSWYGQRWWARPSHSLASRRIRIGQFQVLENTDIFDLICLYFIESQHTHGHGRGAYCDT